MTLYNKSRIILVDDHQIVLDSLSLLLSSFEDIEIVAAFQDGNNAIEFIQQGNMVDLVVTDMRMPNMNGIELCAKLRVLYPEIKLLMLTMVEDAKQIREAIKIGIDGYVLKLTDVDELIKGIRTVIGGKKYFSDEVIIELAIWQDDSAKPGGYANLTIRELEILRHVGKEMSTNEIAEKLFISVATVETHRRNLMQKIGAKSVVGLVLFAVKHKLLD